MTRTTPLENPVAALSQVAGTVGGVELTAAERQVIAHETGRLRVRGVAGAGKTAVLLERWQRSAGAAGAEQILVVCRSRDAADRFRQAVLSRWRSAASALPITTWYGVAFDLVQRHAGEHRLLTRADQWSLVRRLLAADSAAAWPSCPEMVRRAAFVDEVAAAVAAVETSGLDDARLLEAASAGGVESRWSDLLDFRRRYRFATESLGALDGPQLLSRAAGLLRSAEVAGAEGRRWSEVLVDDAEVMTPCMAAMIDRLAPVRLVATGNPEAAIGASHGQSAAWFESPAWDATVTLGPSRRAAQRRLLRCRHPSAEPDAVAGALLAARDEGVEWCEMAVLVRSGRQRAQSMGRALTRYGIPVGATPGSPAGEPVVRAMVDFFAWAGGDTAALDRLLVSPAVDLSPAELRGLRRSAETSATALSDDHRIGRLFELRDRLAPQLGSADPAGLAYQVWQALLSGQVPDPDRRAGDPAEERAVDALVAFLAGLARRAGVDPAWRLADELALVEAPDFDPDPWVRVGPGTDREVTLTTLAAAAGREWDTVVLAGGLEGELPRISGRQRFFDRAVLDLAIAGAHDGAAAAGAHDGAAGAAAACFGSAGIAARRRRSLAEERRLFDLGASRAVRQLIVTAAPQAGELVSRFVAALPSEPVRLPRPLAALSGPRPAPASETAGLVPVHPDRTLVLSASQLMTYDDCPLRYGYQYALGVRSDAGVAAAIGSIVHEALARYLDPQQPPDPSWLRLEAIAGSLWSESIAPYQPMREQARRDIFGMLHDWWEAEPAKAWPPVAAVEYPFEIAVGEHRVRGYIDRIDRLDGGIAIVDYKTGSRVTRADQIADDLQLATYHLAAIRDPQLVALGPPVSLSLVYLRKGEHVEQIITADHEARTEQRILDTAERILAEDFEPSVEADCEFCDFWRLCPLQAEGRQVGAE